ncbi:MAG TPA: hypothetical protein VFO60_09505 [Candidatus Dormibacteraeota bacterium]|nr:hypothetical protein [Candidatus Dormibacteraeota bacterium]
MWRHLEPDDQLEAAVIAHLRRLPPTTFLRWNDADVFNGIVGGEQVDIALEPVCSALGVERAARVLTPDAAARAGHRGPLDIVLAHNALVLTDETDPFRRVAVDEGRVTRDGEHLGHAWTTARISAELTARVTAATTRRDLPVVWAPSIAPTDVRFRLAMPSPGHAADAVARACPMRSRSLTSTIHGGGDLDGLSRRAGLSRGPRPGAAP